MKEGLGWGEEVSEKGSVKHISFAIKLITQEQIYFVDTEWF